MLGACKKSRAVRLNKSFSSISYIRVLLRSWVQIPPSPFLPANRGSPQEQSLSLLLSPNSLSHMHALKKMM